VALFAKRIIIITQAAAFSVWFLKFKSPRSPVGIAGVTPTRCPEVVFSAKPFLKMTPAPGSAPSPDKLFVLLSC